MVLKNHIICFLIVLIFSFSQLFSQDQPLGKNEKHQRIEKFLFEYYTVDLQIADVIVKIDNEIVAISGTPDFRDRGKAIGQIVLAIAGAGIAAPWTRDIYFTIQIEGMPLGIIEVPTRKAMLASEGKISQKAFISSFIATQLSIPFDFPKDLLVPVLKSAEIWKSSSIVECDATKIEELLSVNAEGFIPEFLESAYVKADPGDGFPVCVAGVIDFEKEKEAMDFFALNKKESKNFLIQRIGSIIYIIKGPEEIIKRGKAALNPKPGKKVTIKNDGITKNLFNRKSLIIVVGFFVLFIIILIIFVLTGIGIKN